MYAEARKAGALGGKMTGAGGGGYMLFYCLFENRHKVAAALRKMGAIPTEFAFDAKGLQTWKVQERRPPRSPLGFQAEGRRAGTSDGYRSRATRFRRLKKHLRLTVWMAVL